MDDTSEEPLATAMTLDPEGAPVEDAPADGAPAEGELEPVPTKLGPGAKLTDDELERRAAALVFAATEPLSLAKLTAFLEYPPAERVREALGRLDERFDSAGLPLRVTGLRGGYTVATTEDVAEVVARLSKGSPVEKVSPAALETLAVIAYRQPATKAEIEAIRGVQAGPILRSLVDRGLARVVGRADQPGHPLQYGTTKEFLDRFGLMSLKELPRDTELARD